MTMSNALMDALTARGLDVELLDHLGWDGLSHKGPDGIEDALVIPFKRDGQIVRRKYRTFGAAKRFWQDKSAVRCAWNEDCLRDDSLLAQPLLILEGEIDAATAIQCGFARAISVPDGAPPANPDRQDADLSEGSKYQWVFDAQPLLTVERVPEIIIGADGDANGAQLLHDLASLLGKYRCKYLTYPRAKDPKARGRERLKDLNEVLEDYGPKGVVETIGRASYVKVAGVYQMSDFPPKPTRRVYDIGFDAYGEHYRLRLGDFVVVTGTPGSGKSTLVQDIVCRVVERHGLKAAWGSFEQDPQEDHRRNFWRWFNRERSFTLSPAQKDAADAWIDRHHVFIVPDEDGDCTLDWLIEKIETAVLRHRVQIVVIDPWNELEHARAPGESQTEYVGRAIKTLKKLAARLQFHLIVVAHPTKMQREKGSSAYPEITLYDISDSAHWYNKADLGIIVHRMGLDDTKVKTAKSRYHDVIGVPGSVIMQFCKDDGHFRETERALE